MPTGSVKLLTEDGAEHLPLGSLITSDPARITRKFVVHNYKNSAVTLHFGLSGRKHGLLRLVYCFDQSVDTLQLESEPEGNFNFLYRSFDDSLNITVPALATETVSLSFTSSESHRSRLQAEFSAITPFSVSLLALDEEDNTLASLVLTGSFHESNLQLETLRIDYGHCEPMVWTFRELRICNISPVPTKFCLSSGSRLSSCLRFIHSGSGHLLHRASVPIGGNDECVVRVGFRPEGAGKEEKWFCVENLYNPSDIWHVRVFANARSDRIAQIIDVDCGSSLDFGDCYASCSTFRDVILSSKSNEDVRVNLISDRRHQIQFELLQEWTYDDISSFDERETVLGENALRFSSRHHSSRLKDILERPVSPLGSTGAQGLRASNDGSTQGLEAFKRQRHSSGPVFSSLHGSQTETRDHVKQRSGFERTKTGGFVLLASGQKRRIRVWYLPLCVSADQDKGSPTDSDLDQGRLLPDSFQLSFRLQSGESRIIEGRARVCESILRLEREHVHLGDCNVLTKYKTVLSVINCSDLGASASISYVSQCVVATSHELKIAPRETYDLVLDFIPRQVNPQYFKEVTVTNRWNSKSPNLVFMLRANCIDRQGISLHALFYKILAPYPTNEIDFGVTVANHPAIRAFKVRNITREKLVLKLGGGNGVKIYMPSRIGDALSLDTCSHKQREGTRASGSKYSDRYFPPFSTSSITATPRDSLQHINALVDSDYYSRHGAGGSTVSVFNLPSTKLRPLCELRDHDGTGKHLLRIPGVVFDDPPEVNDDSEDTVFQGKENWVEFLRCLEGSESPSLDSMPTFFSNHESELSYTDRQFRPTRRLQAALRAGYLSEGSILVLGPEAESLVVSAVVLNDSEVRGKTKTRPFEKKLVVQMLAFDNTRLSDTAPDSSKELIDIAKRFEHDQRSMPREILLTVQACKSKMQIEPLRQLNFGSIPCGEQKDKVFTIVNMAEAPLLYNLKKSGVETSDDLRFNVGKSMQGVVRPYFSKLVPFIYSPTRDGFFEERIIVENRLDSSASCELVVKAVVANICDRAMAIAPSERSATH